jgi:PmbA protein
MNETSGISERAVALAEKLGADEAEAYAVKSKVKSVTFSDKIELGNTSIHEGFGVRVIVDKRLGFRSVSSLREGDVEEAIRIAVDVAKASVKDTDWVQMSDHFGSSSVEGIYCKDTAEISPDDLLSAVGNVIETVHEYDSRVSPTEGHLNTSDGSVAICNSHGGEMIRKGTHAFFWINTKAEDGVRKSISAESSSKRSWLELKLEELSKKASSRAVKMLNARHIGGGEYPIILSNSVSATVVNLMFARTMTAEAVQKKRSPWAEKRGLSIAAKNFSLIDNGLLKGGVGTKPFDDEGHPQQKTNIVSKGVLQDFLYDSYTANKEKRTSTGNAVRSYGSLPRPGTTNLMVNEGDSTIDEMIAETSRGLYVLEVIGEWLSNPISGQLSATVTNGFLIKKGELTTPVKGVIISGNFFEVLDDGFELMGDDIDNSGRCYCPSLKISSLNVAGT